MSSPAQAAASPQIRQHYLLEKRLAQQILNSSRQNRARVTMEAYDELFSTLPRQTPRSCSSTAQQDGLREKWLLFGHLLAPRSDVLEIGAGNGDYIRFLAQKTAGRCAGIDISKEVLTPRAGDPPNLELYIMDAAALDFPANTFDLAISDQLIEHLHPDDVELHFSSVCSVLKKNGRYSFRTPSRLLGPHDVSKYFDSISTGFHLKEWTYGELMQCLRKVGFRRMRTMILPYHWASCSSLARALGTVPTSLLVPAERMAARVENRRVRTAFCKSFRIAAVNIIAVK